MVKVKEYEATIEQMKIEQKKVEGEQRRKYLEEENRQAKLKTEYQDQLARRRYEDQLVQQQKMQVNNIFFILSNRGVYFVLKSPHTTPFPGNHFFPHLQYIFFSVLFRFRSLPVAGGSGGAPALNRGGPPP